MKGTPDVPQCGFSRAVIQALDLHDVPPEKIQTYNVLADPELRSGIKEYSYVEPDNPKRRCLSYVIRAVNGQQYPNSM